MRTNPCFCNLQTPASFSYALATTDTRAVVLGNIASTVALCSTPLQVVHLFLSVWTPSSPHSLPPSSRWPPPVGGAVVLLDAGYVAIHANPHHVSTTDLPPFITLQAVAPISGKYCGSVGCWGSSLVAWWALLTSCRPTPRRVAAPPCRPAVWW